MNLKFRYTLLAWGIMLALAVAWIVYGVQHMGAWLR
jgi:hypothetical protein